VILALVNGMGVKKLPAMLKKCAGPKRKIDDTTIRSSRKKWVVGMDVSCAVVVSDVEH
jgi:hypothetical protein